MMTIYIYITNCYHAGGGVYGNDITIIERSIARSIHIAMLEQMGLRIHICHYRHMNDNCRNNIDSYIQEYQH